MKDFNKTNLTLRKDLSRSDLRANGLRAVLMVLLIAFGVGNAWAGGGDKKYYSNLQAQNGTGEGMVYASASATTSPEWAATSTAEKQENDFIFKAYAKAKHGYAFNGWTKGNNTVTVNANTGNGDDIKVTKSSEDNGENIGTVTANWTTASSVNVTYHKPEGGKYTIQYRYDDWNAVNNAFESTTSTSLLSENDDNTEQEDILPTEYINKKEYSDQVKMTIDLFDAKVFN